MSEQAKESAADPDSSATAVTTDVAADRNPTTSPIATKLDKENGTAEEGASNGTKPADPDQEKTESGLQVGDVDDIKSVGDSKRTLNGQKNGTKFQYAKRRNKSKYDASKQPIPDDDAARAETIRNRVRCCEIIT